MILSSIISAIVGSVMDAPVTAPQQTPYVQRSVRSFSDQTKFGEMLPIRTPGRIVIDGHEYPASSILQARGATNLIITPVSIQQPTIVRYQFDNFGNVSRLWVLTPLEIEAALATPVPLPPEETVVPTPASGDTTTPTATPTTTPTTAQSTTIFR